jgi:hypothetical protein
MDRGDQGELSQDSQAGWEGRPTMINLAPFLGRPMRIVGGWRRMAILRLVAVRVAFGLDALGVSAVLALHRCVW